MRDATRNEFLYPLIVRLSNKRLPFPTEMVSDFTSPPAPFLRCSEAALYCLQISAAFLRAQAPGSIETGAPPPNRTPPLYFYESVISVLNCPLLPWIASRVYCAARPFTCGAGWGGRPLVPCLSRAPHSQHPIPGSHSPGTGYVLGMPNQVTCANGAAMRD